MPAPETRFAVLLFTDIVGSTELKARHGVPAYNEALRKHNGHFERIAGEHLTTRTLQNRGDGYFAEAGSVAEAVRFALLFQEAMRGETWGDVRLAVCIGIHAGEISAFDEQDGTWIVGPAADLAARVTSLAVGGQILLTRFPFDEARHFIREHPPVAGKPMPPLRWLAHGPYLLKGRDEPMDIFEVGAEGLAPLTAPPDSEKAKSAIRPGEEETLGWRPAVGLEIPGRTGWHLTEKLGAGGFGEVWTGEHAKLRQRRAFKFCFDDERLRALKREVTLVRLLRTALGERDDIVHLHELKLDAPPFYLESDLAPHGNLLQWADSQGGLHKIPLTQRIALVAHTATALAAAHSIGVLHKDIKPTNILIFDGPGGEPRPRLVDFGIGTLADPAVLGEHGVTGAGFTRATIQHSTGTPTYSPPEYLAGKPYTIQGDIYGLGVLLYQLITAKPLDPLAPGWERDIADPLLREDIAACVDGDPARRLSSAAVLAERLHQLDERRAEIVEKERLTYEAAALAEAEAAALADRVRGARLRKLATAFAILALLAIVGGAVAWKNARTAEKERTNAMNERDHARTAEREAKDQRQLAETAREKAERNLYLASMSLATEAWEQANIGRLREILEETRNYPDRGFEWYYWQRQIHLELRTLRGHKSPVTSVAFSPDGRRIATGSSDKTVKVWDMATGRELLSFVSHTGGVSSVTFSPNGRRIATGSWDNTAKLWDAETGRELITLNATEGNGVWSIAFSPDGRRIATGSQTSKVWDAETGRELLALKHSAELIQSVAFSPDGRRLATGHKVWDAETGRELLDLKGHNHSVQSVVFSPDGERIATGSRDKTAKLWDTETGRELLTLNGHNSEVQSVAFSPDGRRIVTASSDNSAKIWNAESGRELFTVKGHTDRVESVSFSPDGLKIVTGSADKSAKVWDTGTDRKVLVRHPGSYGIEPEWNVGTNREVLTLSGHEFEIKWVAFSPDGRRIVTGSADRTAKLWDAETGRELCTVKGQIDGVVGVAFSPDGHRLVTATRDTIYFTDGIKNPTGARDDVARIWSADNGRELLALEGHQSYVTSVAFSADGQRIVTGSADKSAKVWDAMTGREILSIKGHNDVVQSVAFSPNDQRICTGSADKTSKVWDAVTGREMVAFKGHTGKISSVAFSPDGLRIVTGSTDKSAKVWDAVTGREILTLKGHKLDVRSVAFSPDGQRIVTGSADKSAKVWDAVTGRALLTLNQHTEVVWSVAFSPDGRRIATGSGDWTAKVWMAASPEEMEAWRKEEQP